MNKLFKIIVFVVMVAALAWGGYKLFLTEEKKELTEVIKADEKSGTKKNQVKEASLPVTLLRITKGDLPMRLPISATAEVWEKATIKAEVNGVVQNIRCTIGSRVGRGQELVKLDDSEIRLEVERCEASRLQGFSKYLTSESIGGLEEKKMSENDKANLDKLKNAWTQAEKDYENGKISEKQMDDALEKYQEAMVYTGVLREEIRKAQEGFSEANIRLKQAKLNLKRTSIRSPFPGIISDIMISKGENITAGREVLKIVNLQSLYLKGFALESEMKHLKEGIPVRIKFDAFPDRHFYGKIKSISPEIDATNKTISLFVTVDNKNNLIKPGMHASIDVEYKVHKDVLRVPRDAVIVRQRPLIFIVNEKDRIANWEYVELGEKNDEDQIILKGLNNGLKEGDLIVIDGHLTLAHQSKVKILNIVDQK